MSEPLPTSRLLLTKWGTLTAPLNTKWDWEAKRCTVWDSGHWAPVGGKRRGGGTAGCAWYMLDWWQPSYQVNRQAALGAQKQTQTLTPGGHQTGQPGQWRWDSGCHTPSFSRKCRGPGNVGMSKLTHFGPREPGPGPSVTVTSSAPQPASATNKSRTERAPWGPATGKVTLVRQEGLAKLILSARAGWKPSLIWGHQARPQLLDTGVPSCSSRRPGPKMSMWSLMHPHGVRLGALCP